MSPSSLEEYLVNLWRNAKASLTMWVAAFWVILGVVEVQMNLLQPLIGDKWYGVASIVVSSSLALARMRSLTKSAKK